MNQIASGQAENGQDSEECGITWLIEPRSLTRQCLAAWLEQWQQSSRIRAVPTPDAATTEQDEGDAVLLIWCVGALPITSERIVSGIQQLRSRFPSTPIAILADREEPSDIRAAIRLGIRGYVPTSLDRSEAMEVLKFIRAGGTYVPASPLVEGHDIEQIDKPSCQNGKGHALPQPNMFEGLTPREADVVERLRLGKPNKVIAHELDISESTVKVFVHRILNKLGAVNRTEVAYLAQQQLSSAERLDKPIA